MAKDAEDNKTVDLIGGEDTMKLVHAVVDQAVEDAHLAAEHKLVAIRAYVKDEAKAEKLTNNAERQKRFLEKKKESGEVKTFVPQKVAEEIKAVGGFSSWLEAQKAAPVEKIVEVERIVPVEKIVEVERPVPVELSVDEKRLIKIGRAVEATRGWRRSIIKRLLGV